jgi:hypothetical protein
LCGLDASDLTSIAIDRNSKYEIVLRNRNAIGSADERELLDVGRPGRARPAAMTLEVQHAGLRHAENPPLHEQNAQPGRGRKRLPRNPNRGSELLGEIALPALPHRLIRAARLIDFRTDVS